MSKTIPLTRGLHAIVDDEDFDWLNQWKWHAHSTDGRATRWEKAGDTWKQKTKVDMARLIMDAPGEHNVDHINRNPLDNRRENLRLVSHADNCKNRGVRKDNQAGYKGVRKQRNKWRARIRVDGRLINLGYHNSPEDAALAYNKAALLYFGEFACLNEAG